jgi:biotin carboxyl carrier protein
MKKYRVKVNGKLYEVELEAVEEVKGSVEAPKAASKEATASTTGGATILSPIGGKVLDVKVSVGQEIKKGQVVCIIEAMKLENEVVASQDGVVKEIKATKGAMVANKDVLIVLG